MRHALTTAVALLALAGCTKPSPDAQGTASATAGAPAAAPPAVPSSPRAYVTTPTVLRKDATDASKIPGGKDGKDQANYLATLYRGEQVDVLETREEWVRVKSSADVEGWLKRSAILEAEGVTEATVLAPADVFDRPDLLAANAKKKIDPGTLVLVVKSRPPFSEVNVSASQNAWVLAERLSTGEKEVQVAKLVEKSRYLVRVNKKDEALQNLSMLRASFQGVPLVEVLAAELGVAPLPPPDAGATPAPDAAATAAPPAQPAPQ